MKMRGSDKRQNFYKAGEKGVGKNLTHGWPPLFPKRNARTPKKKPPVEAESSARADKNSCTAPKGNDPLGKASFSGSRPTSKIALLEELNPSRRRISICNSAIRSAFFMGVMALGLAKSKGRIN